MRGNDCFQELADFTAEFVGYAGTPLGPQTRLLEDLGIAGDDGSDFLDAYGRQFGVDMAACDPVDYFGPEASFLVGDLVLLVTDRRKLGHVPLTLADLEKMTRSGIWFPPDRVVVEPSFSRVLWIAAAGLCAVGLLAGALMVGLLLIWNFWA